MPKPQKPLTPSPDDVVLVHGVTDDGKGYHVVRKRGEELCLGAVRPLEEGRPIHGEVVRLKPREESPVIFDVEVQHAPPAAAEGPEDGDRSGPAQVASPRYRSGWDAIWGARPASRNQLN